MLTGRTKLLLAAKKSAAILTRDAARSFDSFVEDKAEFKQLQKLKLSDVDPEMPRIVAEHVASLGVPPKTSRAQILAALGFSVTAAKQPKPALPLDTVGGIAAGLASIRGITDLNDFKRALNIPVADEAVEDEPAEAAKGGKTTKAAAKGKKAPAAPAAAAAAAPAFDPESDDLMGDAVPDSTGASSSPRAFDPESDDLMGEDAVVGAGGFDPESDDVLGSSTAPAADDGDEPELHTQRAVSDEELYGTDQPPVEQTEAERLRQTADQLNVMVGSFDPESDDILTLGDTVISSPSDEAPTELLPEEEEGAARRKAAPRGPADILTAAPAPGPSATPEVDDGIASETNVELEKGRRGGASAAAIAAAAAAAEAEKPAVDLTLFEPDEASVALSSRLFRGGAAASAASAQQTTLVRGVEEAVAAAAGDAELEAAVAGDDDDVLGLTKEILAEVAAKGVAGRCSVSLLVEAATAYGALRSAMVRTARGAAGDSVEKCRLLHATLDALGRSRVSHLGLASLAQDGGVGRTLDETFDLYLLASARRDDAASGTPAVELRGGVSVSVRDPVLSKVSRFPPCATFHTQLRFVSDAAAGRLFAVSDEAFQSTFAELYPLVHNLFGITRKQVGRYHKVSSTTNATDSFVSTADKVLLARAAGEAAGEGGKKADGKAPPRTPSNVLQHLLRPPQLSHVLTRFHRERYEAYVPQYHATCHTEGTEEAVVTSRIGDLRRVSLAEVLEGCQTPMGSPPFYQPVGREGGVVNEVRIIGTKVTVTRVQGVERKNIKTGQLAQKGGEIVWEVVVQGEHQIEPIVTECKLHHEWEHAGSRSSKVSKVAWFSGSSVTEEWYRSMSDATRAAGGAKGRAATPTGSQAPPVRPPPTLESTIEDDVEPASSAGEEEAFGEYRQVSAPAPPSTPSGTGFAAPPPPK